jgi:CRISPR/Cas system CSM-associated protein Csm3 (group 7 of RAMP superfamily)
MEYKKRFLANIVIEANTPLKIGSSALDMLQDAPVQKDWNNLPMILGTSITGVLRKEFDHEFANDVFGDEDSKKDDNKGSRIIISNALLCDENMKVNEGLLLEKSDFLKSFDSLPLRDHVHITDKGVADTANSGKFDEEVVYKGSRFKFRIELIATQNEEEVFSTIIKKLNSEIFRLGSGTTKGFGDINVLHEYSTYEFFDLDSDGYREKSSSLNTEYANKLLDEKSELNKHTCYTLKLKSDDFFMFGSGFGDDDADMTPVYEKVIDYKNKKLSEDMILIPASSIKGALAHRTTFYYNKLHEKFIENTNGVLNVVEIFGAAKDDENHSEGAKGKILMSDCFATKMQTKTFDHVSIDRFTGGAIDSALFQEKTTVDNSEYTIEILLHNDVEKKSAKIVEAFELALKDIVTGMLSLGGATTKGHGIFSGNILKNGESYEI